MSQVPEIQSTKELKPTSPKCLPDDISCDIISRLPPKEVAYFKTFSKHLYQMLSDPSFKDLYKERSNKNPKLCIACISNAEYRDEKGEIIDELFLRLSSVDLKQEEEAEEEEAEEAEEVEEAEEEEEEEEEEEGSIYNSYIKRKIDAYTRMLYASNGGSLICFANHEEFFIFNPTSKRFANLPEISFTTNEDFSKAGLGYVPSNNEYIFVHIFDVSDEYTEFDMRCEWLTLSEANQHEDLCTSLSWKVIKTPCPFPARRSGVLVNGLFYFCVSDGCDHTAKQVIFSIDLKKEHFKVIGHPDETLYNRFNTTFVAELNGELCFGDIFQLSAEMDLWILKNAENAEWMTLCRVDLRRLNGSNGRLVSQIALLGLRNGELIIQNIKNDRLHYYNIEEETAREGTVSIPTWSQICIYYENLSFLNIRSS